MQVKPTQIGPSSPLRRLRRLDGRTRAAKWLAQTEAALVEHLGGPDRVGVAKRILVERLSADLFRLELLDELAASGGLTEHDGRVAHALRNSVRLTLREVGLEPADEVGNEVAAFRARRPR